MGHGVLGLPFTGGKLINASGRNILVWDDDSGIYFIEDGEESSVVLSDVDYFKHPYRGWWYKIPDGITLKVEPNGDLNTWVANFTKLTGKKVSRASDSEINIISQNTQGNDTSVANLIDLYPNTFSNGYENYDPLPDGF
jgi:hypothetical protein